MTRLQRRTAWQPNLKLPMCRCVLLQSASSFQTLQASSGRVCSCNPGLEACKAVEPQKLHSIDCTEACLSLSCTYETKHDLTCHQGKAAVAAAATDAAQHCEQQIKELSAAKASLTQQVEQGQQAFKAQEEATASLTRDLEAQQVRAIPLELCSALPSSLVSAVCIACSDQLLLSAHVQLLLAP